MGVRMRCYLAVVTMAGAVSSSALGFGPEVWGSRA